MKVDYEYVMKLWEEYKTGLEAHGCGGEEFTGCEICEFSHLARARLRVRLPEILDLLERYHDILDDLATNVIQEVTLPRAERLQMAMLKALTVLEKSDGN